ncbi:MAG: hypothetical protein LC126_31420 [Bryobacterales bacterium]|nr:hypothetical protein [Bryobacterales bacterium]
MTFARSVSLHLIILGSATVALGQIADFPGPHQKGPFAVNGLNYVEMVGGFVDPVNIGVPVPPIDQAIAEVVATGANLVKITVTTGFMRNYNDNAYDPSIPLEYKPENVLAFGRKLTARGVPCMLQPFSAVRGVIAGASDLGTDRPNPADRRAWMAQHAPRIVAFAELAEQMGCEYFVVFGDEVEHLFADPRLEDQWAQTLASIRKVFSGRLTSTSGFFDGVYWLSRNTVHLTILIRLATSRRRVRWGARGRNG